MTQPQSLQWSAARVILVPYPVSTLSSLTYYVLEEKGLSSPSIFYRWRAFTKDEDSPTRVCLFGPALVGKLLAELRDVPEPAKQRLRRILNFLQSRERAHKDRQAELQSEIARIPGSAREVLSVCSMYWGHVMRRGLDPFRDGLPPFSHHSDGDLEEALPVLKFREFVYISRPKFEGVDGQGRPRVTGSTDLELEETQARLLLRKHITVGVFGPASVGKSTVAASLVIEMNNLARSLSTRLGWEDFNLKVSSLDLDLGTPTLSAINQGQGQDRESLRKNKRPWTMEMALEGLRQLEASRQSANVLVVDMPGKPDAITELLGTSLDGSIVVTPTGHNDLRAIWRNFAENVLGTECLSQISSMPAGSGEESLARQHQHARTVRGQIVNLNRTARSYDSFISYLSKLLLYDYLPRMVEKRYEARKKLFL